MAAQASPDDAVQPAGPEQFEDLLRRRAGLGKG
jgi:hypothetical protein